MFSSIRNDFTVSYKIKCKKHLNVSPPVFLKF